MIDDFLKQAESLRARNESFAVATVVRCEAPTSGKPGDRAIITADGKLSGWIGGGCAQPIVIQESLKALKDGKPRLLRVSPTAGAEPADGITGYTMMCHSGGTLDIFVDPVLPKPHVVIFGRSPVARTLLRLANVLSYRVSVIAPEESRSEMSGADIQASSLQASNIRIEPQSSVIIATQGEDDEGALIEALASSAAYVAFVASKKKWDALTSFLQDKGVLPDRLKNVHVPAGIEIGARTPEEIAVSILAQLIQVRSKPSVAELPKLQMFESPRAKDPVCGMTVQVSAAKYSSQFNQQTIYFCCAHCKSTFDKDPASFMTAPS